METIYYHLDARCVSVCGMASGESAPVHHSYAVLRRARPRPAECGKVLDLAAYRRKLEGEIDSYTEETPAIPAPVAAAPKARRHTRRALFALDFFATGAVLVMAIVVVTAFLPFL